MKKYTGHPQMIKKINKNLIEKIIKEQGPISKPEIAKHTKLSLPTVNKTVEELLQLKKVKISGETKSNLGRRAKLYEISGEGGYLLGLFCDDRFMIKGIMTNLLGEHILQKNIAVDLQSKDDISNSLFKAINFFIEKAGDDGKIKSIGIGVPGVVKSNGTIENIINIPAFEGMNLKKLIESRYQIPTFVENEINLTTIGIYHKELEEKCDNMIYLYFGKGIGAGMIIHKKLYKGASNFAGEVSYMIDDHIAPKEFRKVKEKPYFETSMNLLFKEILEKHEKHKLKDLKDILINKENKSKEMEELISKISYFLINIISILNPEIIFLQGDFISDPLIEEIQKYIQGYIHIDNCPKISIYEGDSASLTGTIELCHSGIASNYLLVNDKGV